MLERGGELGLAQEPLPETHVPGELRRNQLQRHIPLQPRIVSLVNNPHPSPAEQRLDPVTEKLRPIQGSGGTGHATP